MTKYLLPVLLGLALPLSAQTVTTKLPISLTINNQGAPEVGFRDGTIPTLFADPKFTDSPQKVAEYINIGDVTASVEPTSTPNTLRIVLEKPIPVALLRYETGAPANTIEVRTFEITLSPEDFKIFKETAAAGSGSLGLEPGFTRKAADLTKSVDALGLDLPTLSKNTDLPEVWSFTKYGLALKLGDLLSGKPIKPYSLRGEFRRLEDTSGRLGSDTISGPLGFEDIVKLEEKPEIKRVVDLTSAIRQKRSDLIQRQFEEALRGIGLPRDQIPIGDIRPPKDQLRPEPPLSASLPLDRLTVDGRHALQKVGQRIIISRVQPRQQLMDILPPEGVDVLTVDSNRRYVVLGYSDAKVRSYKIGTGELVRTISAMGNQVRSAHFDSNSLVIDTEARRAVYNARTFDYLFLHSMPRPGTPCSSALATAN